jgi:hypothetical protein
MDTHASLRCGYEAEVKRFVAVTLFVAAAATEVLVGSAPTYADPPPPCGSPDVPCAGPGPLTPEQQCAWIAFRTWTPCNWLGVQVPAGTPGSLG